MLSALLQTIANLGLDGGVINRAFNVVLEAVRNGSLSSVGGVGDVFSSVFSLFSGVTAGEAGSLVGALLAGVMEMLSNVNSSSVLSVITGA